MLRPSPVRPLEISIVVSQPGMMGQVAGSEAKIAGVDDLLVPKSTFKMKYKKKTDQKEYISNSPHWLPWGMEQKHGPKFGDKEDFNSTLIF